MQPFPVGVRHNGGREVDVSGFSEGDDAQLRPDRKVGDEPVEGALDRRPSTVDAHRAASFEQKNVTRRSRNDVIEDRIASNFLCRRNDIDWSGRCCC